MGDFNVNTILEINNNSKSAKDFINNRVSSYYYYHKLINLPTRERNQTISLLDNIYIRTYQNATTLVLLVY